MAKKSAPVDKTKVDPTDAVREAGTDVYETRSGLRLPDGTLVNYDEEDDDAPGSATVGVAREFDGTDFEVADDQLAEAIGQTSSDDDSDPLTSFLGAAEGKLGRDTTVVTPDEATNASPASGKPSVAEQESDDGDGGDDSGLDSGDDPDSDGGGMLDFTPDSGDYDGDLDSGDDPDDDSGSSVEDPGSDGEEGAPIPAELQAQLDSDVARLRAARPQTGDGATDPSEIESEAVGPAGLLISHAEHGESLFGQPLTEVESGGGPSSNVNPGSDSHGAGVITPGEDQDDGGSFLPLSEDASEVEPGDAIPDAPEPSG